jgi:hypothetical protein
LFSLDLIVHRMLSILSICLSISICLSLSLFLLLPSAARGDERKAADVRRLLALEIVGGAATELQRRYARAFSEIRYQISEIRGET